jgi:hypothetical protein
MLNKDVFARDPSSYELADGGIAKVLFPPENDEKQLAVLREQLETFVCEGSYADGLGKILKYFNGNAGKRADLYAVWISGFYGSGKSLLAAMLGALWTNIEFHDGATAEGLVHDMPSDVKAELRELRGNGKRFGGLLVGGATLGRGSKDPVKAVLEIILKATGLLTAAGPASAFDLRPWQVALWLEQQGILADVRASLRADFERALSEFLLNERLATAALKVNPDLAPDIDTLMERLARQFEPEPEPTPELLVEMARRALMIGRREIPLTLIILDEAQQYVREDSNISLVVQTIAEELCSKLGNRVFLVGTGQSELGDLKYLERLLTRFRVPVPLRSTDINSVIRKTILLRRTRPNLTSKRC